jgi:putative protein kinase ArgK-like GTPase of G3E family
MGRAPADPATLFASARDGDRAATARLLSLVERGGADGRAVGRLAHPLSGTPSASPGHPALARAL